MKKLFLLVSLGALCASSSHAISMHRSLAFLETLLGIGTAGTAVALFHDANSNIVIQGVKHLYNQTVSTSTIAQIRSEVQNLIVQILNPQSISTTLEIERGAYIALGVIGALITIRGVQEYLSDDE